MTRAEAGCIDMQNPPLKSRAIGWVWPLTQILIILTKGRHRRCRGFGSGLDRRGDRCCVDLRAEEALKRPLLRRDGRDSSGGSSKMPRIFRRSWTERLRMGAMHQKMAIFKGGNSVCRVHFLNLKL